MGEEYQVIMLTTKTGKIVTYTGPVQLVEGDALDGDTTIKIMNLPMPEDTSFEQLSRLGQP